MLMRLRDMHMHLRNRDKDGPVENPSSDEPTITILPPEGVIKALRQRGLTWQSDDPRTGVSWLSSLQTKDIAEWACHATLNAILAILDLVPDRPDDTSLMFKRDFRRHAGTTKSGS